MWRFVPLTIIEIAGRAPLPTGSVVNGMIPALTFATSASRCALQFLTKCSKLGVPEVGVLKAETDESHALLNHPLTPQLLAAIEPWIREESLGADAAEAFAQVRAAAIRWMRLGTEK